MRHVVQSHLLVGGRGRDWRRLQGPALMEGDGERLWAVRLSYLLLAGWNVSLSSNYLGSVVQSASSKAPKPFLWGSDRRRKPIAAPSSGQLPGTDAGCC